MATINVKSNSNQNTFRILDRLFWLAWIALPLMTIAIFWIAFDPSNYTQGLSNEESACIGKLPLPPSYSFLGKIIFSCLIGFSILFYVVLFAILHKAIRRFRNGNLFDDQALRSMKWLGMLLIAFPVLDLALGIVASSLLNRIEGAGAGGGSSFLDVGPMAFGLFVLALQQVLQKALAMKSENDLTI